MAIEKVQPMVTVRAKFQRSVRLDVDFDRSDALTGYILQPSPRNALQTVARHVAETQQRAFTWTGPYGGGKSSLALALALLAGGEPIARKAAKSVLDVQADDPLAGVFGGRKPWLVLPVVGRRELVEDAIGETIDKLSLARGRKPVRNGRRDVIAELIRRAEGGEHAGVLLILDELGKFLEAAAAAAEDIFFYQELAEAASRCKGRLVIIGVLHQSFEQYAVRLGREVRDEWSKVQGRYVDIPIVAGTDEVLELIGGAIDSTIDHPATAKIAKLLAASIRNRRPSSPPTLAESLDRCWPLHPVTAALLGPTSRRRFGQNERSVFGFLTSAEPMGFRDFLQSRSQSDASTYYLPARFWDYLRANLENAILSSPDGHRWAVGAEAIERVESQFGEPHLSLVKSTGLIELFRNGSGVTAETDVLVECVPGFSRKALETALEDLAKASILIFRKHLRAWGVFAGSDFDIEAAVSSARGNLGAVSETQLNSLSRLPPVTARRHYVETGTLRWFDREVLPAATAKSAARGLSGSSRTGRFVLLLPSTDCPEPKAMRIASDLSKQDAAALVLYGVPRGQLGILEQASELAALEYVSRNKPELDGDAVAKREIDARLRQLRNDLEGMLRDAFVHARWYFAGERHEVDSAQGISPLASIVCDQIYPDAPRIHSELVNRDNLSSNAAKAQRLLLHRMLAFSTRPNLDYEGYPSDAGLYFTILAELGLHQPQADGWAFVSPAKSKAEASKTILKWWEAAESKLSNAGEAVTLAALYSEWSKPPFGIKQGLLPILALAYLLANRSRIAVYVEGMFVPDLTDAAVDEWLQDPTRISWKAVKVDASTKRLLLALSARLEETLKRPVSADPLDSARALVSMTLALPHWTQRTTLLSERARTVRTLLLRASDPVKVIFTDLPELLGTRETVPLVAAVGDVMAELSQAFPNALRKIQGRLLQAIDHAGDHETLRARARVVQGISGDFKIDAFSSRLQTFSGELADIEGLVSLAVSKPPTGFTDHDLDYASLQLAKWAFEFRRVEAMASIQGRAANRQALAVVFGGGRTISGTFDVSERDGEAVRKLADGMLDRLLTGNVKADVFLAALVEAGSRVLELQREEQSDG